MYVITQAPLKLTLVNTIMRRAVKSTLAASNSSGRLSRFNVYNFYYSLNWMFPSQLLLIIGMYDLMVANLLLLLEALLEL